MENLIEGFIRQNGMQATLNAIHHLQNGPQGKYNAYVHMINIEAIDIITAAYIELRKAGY